MTTAPTTTTIRLPAWMTPIDVIDKILREEEAAEASQTETRPKLCGFCQANLKTQDCPSDCPSWDNLRSADYVGRELLDDVFYAVTDEAFRRIELFKKRTNRRPTLQEINEIFLVVGYEKGNQSK